MLTFKFAAKIAALSLLPVARECSAVRLSKRFEIGKMKTKPIRSGSEEEEDNNKLVPDRNPELLFGRFRYPQYQGPHSLFNVWLAMSIGAFIVVACVALVTSNWAGISWSQQMESMFFLDGYKFLVQIACVLLYVGALCLVGYELHHLCIGYEQNKRYFEVTIGAIFVGAVFMVVYLASVEVYKALEAHLNAQRKLNDEEQEPLTS